MGIKVILFLIISDSEGDGYFAFSSSLVGIGNMSVFLCFFEEEKRGPAGEKNKRDKSHCFLKAWSWEGEEGDAVTRADRTATQRMGWTVNCDKAKTSLHCSSSTICLLACFCCGFGVFVWGFGKQSYLSLTRKEPVDCPITFVSLW